MVEKRQEKLSEEIKVRVDGGIPTIEHSDAYNAQMERFYAGENFTRREKLANQKLIEAEDAQMEAARRDPEGFIRQQQMRMQAESGVPVRSMLPADQKAFESLEPPHARTAPETDQGGDAERVTRAQRAFDEASPEDKAIAIKNLEGIQKKLQEAPYMTHEFLVQAQQKAFIDEGEKLYERNLAENRKDNALTYEVANFSQAPGKNMVNADAGLAVGTGEGAYGADIHHGFDAKSLGLTLAEVNAGATTNDAGAIGAGLGVRAVKQVHGDHDRNVFLAGALNANLSGIETDKPELGGTATALAVHAHELAGMPASEIVGGVVDLRTGNATLVGSVSATLNADTRHATTLRGVGTYGLESGAGGFSLEAYQQTGIKGLTARLATSLNNIGETNDVSVGAGVSYGF